MSPRSDAMTLRIGVLETDQPAPAVLKAVGTYGDIFKRSIQESATALTPGLEIAFTKFDVVKGEYPSCIDDFDAFMVSGSQASAYDRLPWIELLELFISKVYHNHPTIRLYGSCFGHQIIAQSLLAHGGAVIERNPRGWEVGVHPIHMAPAFRSHFQSLLRMSRRQSRDTIHFRLQLIHRDFVRILRPLPSGWMLIGSTSLCRNQGLYAPGRVLTFQGHFEFDSFINWETSKIFGAEWDDATLVEHRKAIHAPDCSDVVSDFVTRFLVGDDRLSRSAWMIEDVPTPARTPEP